MSRAIVKCAKCGKRQYEAEVKYSSDYKDFVCKDESLCNQPLSRAAKWSRKRVK